MLAFQLLAGYGFSPSWLHCGVSDKASLHADTDERTESVMQNKLKVLRAERNWSQAELAERLGVSRQTVNALETGKYDPSLPLTFKIARIFQLPIEEIFQYDPESDGRKI
jgi:putative transcriptional regulator